MDRGTQLAAKIVSGFFHGRRSIIPPRADPARAADMRTVASIAVILLVFVSAPAAEPVNELFESKIRPLFIDHCQKCHGPDKQSGGLRLDSGDALRAGGENGPVVVPGNSAKSKVLIAVRQTSDLKMPPTGKLSDEHIELLDAWVRAGAKWPDKEIPARPAP